MVKAKIKYTSLYLATYIIGIIFLTNSILGIILEYLIGIHGSWYAIEIISFIILLVLLVILKKEKNDLYEDYIMSCIEESEIIKTSTRRRKIELEEE